MGKAQDDEARPVAAQAPRRGAPPRAPSPGPIGRALPVAARGRALGSPPQPAPVECPDPPRPRDAAAALRAPSPLDAPCTRDRRVRPAGGHSGQAGQAGKNRRSPQGGQGTSTSRSRQAAPGTARSTRTSSTQAARSDRRRHNWGAGLQWAHIGGGRLSGAPDSVPQGPDQPRSGRLRKPVPPQPATVCAVPWCWAGSCWSSCCSS